MVEAEMLPRLQAGGLFSVSRLQSHIPSDMSAQINVTLDPISFHHAIQWPILEGDPWVKKRRAIIPVDRSDMIGKNSLAVLP